jgi:hypothetical protein
MVLSCWIWELMLRRMTGKIGTPSLQPKSNFRSFVLESRFYSNPGGGDQPEPRIDGGAAPEEPEILHQLSSSAWIANPLSAALQRISSRLGLQQTWQSSTYCWRPPADSSTKVSFHSPHPAHWYLASAMHVAKEESTGDRMGHDGRRHSTIVCRAGSVKRRKRMALATAAERRCKVFGNSWHLP